MAQREGPVMLALLQDPLQSRQQHQLALSQPSPLPLRQIIADAKRQE